MNEFFATEAMEKRAGFMPRGELTPEQQQELDTAKTRWFPEHISPSGPATAGVSSPGRAALIGALSGGVMGGVGGLGLAGPVGAAIGAPVGALAGGLLAHGGAVNRNEFVEEAMRRGAQNQFDVDTLPQNTNAAIGGISAQLASQAALRRFGV